MLLIRRLQVNLGPLTAWKRICELRGIIDQLLYDEIARCKKEALQQRTDIMAMLVAARDEDGQPMSDDEIRDELITMLVAGHETTATSLSWVVYRLLQNPNVLARAQADVASVTGNGSDRLRAHRGADRRTQLSGRRHQGDGPPRSHPAHCGSLSRSADAHW